MTGAALRPVPRPVPLARLLAGCAAALTLCAVTLCWHWEPIRFDPAAREQLERDIAVLVKDSEILAARAGALPPLSTVPLPAVPVVTATAPVVPAVPPVVRQPVLHISGDRLAPAAARLEVVARLQASGLPDDAARLARAWAASSGLDTSVRAALSRVVQSSGYSPLSAPVSDQTLRARATVVRSRSEVQR